MTKIKSKKITETKNFIKGYFLLTDKSKTKFEINKKTQEWNQWGNSNENLFLSVSRIENIIEQGLSNMHQIAVSETSSITPSQSIK